MRRPHSRSTFARFGRGRFELALSEGDISQWRPQMPSCKCAAVVTPSNESLMGNEKYRNWWKFSGKKNADTFVHQKAGKGLQRYLNELPEIVQGSGRKCRVGEYVLAQIQIHACTDPCIFLCIWMLTTTRRCGNNTRMRAEGG